jgi:PAS domain S-box-containing protein
VGDLAGHLSTAEEGSIFAALERAATSLGLGVFVVHVNASPPTLIYCSEMLGELVGRPVSELTGRPPWDLVAAHDHARVQETISTRGPGAPPIALEFQIQRPDGERRDIEVGVARITTADAELAVCYFRDRTREHEALAALRRSEAHFRSLIENAPDGVVILQQGRIVLANSVAVGMFGLPSFEAVRGRLLSEFLPSEEATRAIMRIGQLMQGAEVQSSEYRLNNNFIGEVHSTVCEYEGKPSILAFVRDVTERRRIQEHLVRTDRLAALGTMAATVAHEINNPLTYLQLELQRLDRFAATETDPARAALLREHVANALHGVERVARIVRDLRAHSRDATDEPESAVDVVTVAEQALQLVEHDLRHRAQLVRKYSNAPAIIQGSPHRLEQVIVNLLVNAIQALDGSSSNQITIQIEADAEITLSITDTGPGLPDPDRVFEPFFTTKPIGEGTGLGLSVCKQLVEGMRGKIQVVRTGPQGTTIAVVLPRRALPSHRLTPAPTVVRGDRLRILVIDDEPLVLNAMRDLLNSDHDVETVDNGESALSLVDSSSSFDVILCDVMMPRMNGRDVYERLRTQHPGLENRVVFVTGGAFVPTLASFLDSVDNLKLRKPFTIEHVLSLVQQAHQRRSPKGMS